MMNFEMEISLGRGEGKWMIHLHCDSMANFVQDILYQFTPPCLPTNSNNLVVLPQGLYLCIQIWFA